MTRRDGLPDLNGQVTIMIIDQWLEAIKQLEYDPEAAHSREDDLHAGILRAIAEDRCADPKGCAARTLHTHDLKFERWCG